MPPLKEINEMKKIIAAILGKAGSGKDTLLNKICAERKDYNRIINCTTRSKRSGEKDGVDYYFLTPDDFVAKIMDGDMLEVSTFNDWYYGTMKSSLKEGINIGIFNPESFDCLLQILSSENVEIVSFFLDCSDKERLIRQLRREEEPDIDEIIRRYQADKIDFYDENLLEVNEFLPSDNLQDLKHNITFIQNYLDEKIKILDKTI